MKSKKLISLLCAAAMSVSAFAGLATTASAAATPVWTFDGSSADDWEGTVTPTVETDEGSTDNYLNFAAAVGKASNDTTFVLPTAAQLTDDYVLEYDTYIHGGNGMGRLNHYTQVAFAGESPVLDTQTYGGDYATAAEAINPDPDHHWSQDENTGNGYTTDIVSSLTSRIELSCQGKWVINQKNVAPNFATDGTTVGDDKWVRVRAEVKGGKAKVTIADSNQTYVDGVEFDADATKLAQIKLTFGRADGVNFVPTTASTIKLDNIKVYDGIAGTPAFSTDGLRKTAVVATPVPRAENVAGAAPNLYAPEGAIAPYKANFDDAEAGTILSIDTAAQDPKPIVNGLTLNIGNRPDGADTMSYGAIVDVKDGSKALKLQANNYATNGRGPIVSFDDDLSIDDMTGTTSVLGFSVYLSRTAVDGIERLFLIDNTENVDGNSCARDVVAVLTTEEIQNEDGSYKYTAGESNIGVHLDPEKWNTVALAISENEYRLFVNGVYRTDGNLSPALKNDLVGTGEGNKNAVKHLPMFAIENTKASTTAEDGTVSGGTVFSSVLIDNVLTYQIQAEVSDKLLPTTDGTDPSPAPTATATPQPKHDVTVAYADGTATVSTEETDEFDAVVVAANYNAAHQLDKIAKIAAVKVKKDTPATVTGLELAEGDKIMVWNSVAGMIPYGAHTVTAAEANATQPTAPPTIAPATPTPGAVTDPTPTPGAPTATPAPKFAVTVATAENGKVTADKTTAAEGETVTLTVTPNMGYEGTVTVKDADNGDVTVTDNKFTMPAKAVNVTATFAARTDVVLSTASTYLSRYNGLTEDIATQVAKNYADDTKVLVGTNGNYNAIGLYKFAAPAIPADKEIASAKLTIVNKEMNNKNGDSSVDVNYPDVSTGIDFSTITWNTMFTQATVDDGTNLPFVAENMQEAAPFKSITKLATVNIAKGETNVTHGDIDVTSYVKAQTKKNEDIVIVLNKCTRGANLDKVAMIEYTLQDKTYTANVTAPAETDGTLSVDKAAYNKDETVTITATAKPGKKVAGVTVMNGDTPVNVTAGENGTYTFTMPEADVTVSATFARADIATIEVAGPKTVSSAATSTYTATAKAADGTVLEGVTFTWTVTGGGDGTAITDAGVLTVADAEADQTALTIKAAAEEKEGTLAVAVTKATVYTITKAEDITGGSIATDKIVGIEGAEVTVTPTAAAGYHVTAVTYTPAEGTAQTITPAEGVYKFAMPAANVTVSATFAKTDFAITNATAADAGGTISFTVGENIAATTAQMDDEVTVTVTPETGKELAALTYKADSAAEATAITATEGAYKFTMPAEAVTVTATFQKEALVRPVVSGVDVISTYDTTAVRVGDRNVLQAPTGNKDFTVTDTAKNVVTYDTDFLVSDGEVLSVTFGRSKGDSFGGQSSTLIITGASGAITMKGQNGGSSFTGLTWTGEAPALTSGTWYRLTATTKSNGTAWDGAAIAIYAVDPTTCEIGNKLGEGTLSHRTGSNTEWNRIQYSVTGTPSIDNTYVYTPAKYAAEVTVVDGDNAAVEGVTVTLNDLAASTATTNAEGKATFNVPAGEYTVTVEKLAYNAPADEQKITVTAEGGAKTVTMTAISQTLTSVDIKGGMTNHTVLTKGTDTVAAKLVAVGYDADGAEMATQPAINWTSDSENTTVANGVVTVKSTQAAGTVTITATAADTAISDTYTFTVAATGTETVLLATEDFEDDVNNFVLANGASVGTFKDSKVLKLGDKDGAKATMTLDTPVTAVTGDTVKVTWTAYNGWLTSGADTVWTIKNSNDEVVLSYTYNTGTCNITAVTLAGVAQEVTAFNFQQNGSKQNGWGSFSYANQNTVELTLNADGSATVVFKKGTTTAGTYTVEAANTQLTTKDIKSAEMLNHALNDDRSGGFDNFTTTITRAE